MVSRVVVSAVVCLFVFASSLTADPAFFKSKTLTVLGTLNADLSAGATPDWSITLNPVLMFNGRQISSLEIKSSNTHKLVSLEDKFVQAKGQIKFVSDADTPERPILELWSIKEHKTKEPKKER
jgi:hypothetical protein